MNGEMFAEILLGVSGILFAAGIGAGVLTVVVFFRCNIPETAEEFFKRRREEGKNRRSGGVSGSNKRSTAGEIRQRISDGPGEQESGTVLLGQESETILLRPVLKFRDEQDEKMEE